MPPEVAATAIRLPRAVRVNQAFSADIRVASSTPTEADLQVFKDGFVVKQMKVELDVGENSFRIPGLYFEDKGFHI